MSQWEVCLSASVPVPREGRHPDFAERTPPKVSRHVELAVQHLAAAVIQEGGRIVFGGHPSITPRIAQVAADLAPKIPKGSRPIVVYQSGLYEKLLVDEAKLLRASPVVEYVSPTPIRDNLTEVEPMNGTTGQKAWLEALDQALSKFRPSKGDDAAARRREASLLEMRHRMLERPNLRAMFAVGGYDGVLDEAVLFLQGSEQRLLRLMTTTGGAAQVLASEMEALPIPGWGGRLAAVEGPFLESKWGAGPNEGLIRLLRRIPRSGALVRGDVPYNVVMDLLVREIAG